MAINSVAILGVSRLAEELVKLSQAGGLSATLHADAATVPSSASLVVETQAAPESEKRELLNKLDARVSGSTVIVSSCLAFSPTLIGSWSAAPERVVGFATFYPLADKKVVELSGGLRAGEASLEQAEEFFRRLGKETARVKDTAGLIFPRILSLIINEAARALDEGVAEEEAIDAAMKLGVNYPSGPLRWADRVGIDEVLAVLEGAHRESGDDRYRPSPLLKKMVAAGWLGEASGKGFYSYNEGKR
jgi:3-hydroxybutyryl-CoA dehydrogenase